MTFATWWLLQEVKIFTYHDVYKQTQTMLHVFLKKKYKKCQG